MYLRALLMVATICIWQTCGSISGQEVKTGAGSAPVSEGVIKVTITTGGGVYGPEKSQFKVGEEIPVTISMSNTGDQPAKYCLSTSLFQNRPHLTRDGQEIPYLTKLPGLVDEEKAIQTCENSEAKRIAQLQPKQKRAVDWFVISQRGVAWYGPLPAGRYELVLRRRIGCCQGSMEVSNTVTFEIVP